MTLSDETEALNVVSKAMARRLGHNRSELTLANGIVLEFRSVSPILTGAVRAELELNVPKPPVVWLEEKGRNEENPNDPDYLAALERQQHLNDVAMSDVITYSGVEIKHVPEGLFPPEHDGWLSDPRIIMARRSGLDFDAEDTIKRKVVWMRLYAIEDYVDARLWDEVQTELIGIREEEVQEALAGFRDIQGRPADRDGAAAPDSTNGNTGNRASRRASPRVRGA